MVPPRGRMPLTSLSVSSNDFSGQMRPSKPSGMPMTFHPYLMMAALVAARMTALRPGASPPPVLMPMQRMSDMRLAVGLPHHNTVCSLGHHKLRVDAPHSDLPSDCSAGGILPRNKSC